MRSRICCLLGLLITPDARGAEPPEHRVNGDLAIRTRDIFRRYCSECHTGSADPSRSKLKLMDHAQVTGRKTPVPLAAPNGRAQIIELVKDGSMPPANRPGPTAEEIAVLERWVKAKAPAYPLAFDEQYTLNAIADDFAPLNAKGATAAESVRYVSFVHLLQDGQPIPDLVTAEQQLRDALSAVAGQPVAPEPVDPTATLFRIDTLRLGWSNRALFDKMEGLKPSGGAVRLRPFDLLLLEYPHARPGDPQEPRLKPLLARTAQVLPVPFVRGDWLSGALVTKGKLTPLADDIRALAALDQALAKKDPEPDGPVAQPFASGGAFTGKGTLPPLSGWYGGDVAPEKPAFALEAELVVADKAVTGVKVDEPFLLRVSCDRKVFFTLLGVQADGEIRVHPVQGGTVLQPTKERLLSPNGVGFVIPGIPAGGDKATEYFVLFASESELPLPTVLRSKHADKYVWRFLMGPTASIAFDPNAVVRKVIPIKVTRK